MCLMCSALDGAEELEHVEHRVRLGAVGNDGAVVDIGITFTRTYTRLSVSSSLFINFFSSVRCLVSRHSITQMFETCESSHHIRNTLYIVSRWAKQSGYI
jgi:hypothetical protein